MRRIFLEPLQELVEYDELRTDMKKGRGPLQAGGCLESQKAHLLGALFEEAGCGCHLVVTYSEKRAKELAEDLALFADGVCFYPAKDMLFYAADVQGSVTARARLGVVRRLAEYREKRPAAAGAGAANEASGSASVTVVTTIDGLMDLGKQMLGWYALVLACFLAITVAVCSVRYYNAQKRLRGYRSCLRKLMKSYQEEGTAKEQSV